MTRGYSRMRRKLHEDEYIVATIIDPTDEFSMPRLRELCAFINERLDIDKVKAVPKRNEKRNNSIILYLGDMPIHEFFYHEFSDWHYLRWQARKISEIIIRTYEVVDLGFVNFEKDCLNEVYR